MTIWMPSMVDGFSLKMPTSWLTRHFQMNYSLKWTLALRALKLLSWCHFKGNWKCRKKERCEWKIIFAILHEAIWPHHIPSCIAPKQIKLLTICLFVQLANEKSLILSYYFHIFDYQKLWKYSMAQICVFIDSCSNRNSFTNTQRNTYILQDLWMR